MAGKSPHLKTLIIVSALAIVTGGRAEARDDCPDGTLWEPYTEVCAEVRDAQQLFWDLAIGASGNANETDGRTQQLIDSGGTRTAVQTSSDDFPVPGRIRPGIAYSRNQLRAVESGRLHTRMFIHPDGLQPDGELPLFYTPATSRINRGLEFVGVYSADGSGAADGLGRVALFAWTCVPDYPCPNGSERPRWQWFIRQGDLSCHVTHDVDQGGHPHKMLYYANHTDKLADDTPPLWRSALYLWNYCDGAWDLAWEHVYQQDKKDCSAQNDCAWWGPGIETFNSETHPLISELGFEDSLLYHDGQWSELRPPETSFRNLDPAGPLSRWQLFHLDANRGWGVGSYLKVNEAPAIEEQTGPIETAEDTSILIDEDMLTITDPDVDSRFHVAYDLTIYGNDNYTYDGLEVTPDEDFTGTLTVPVTANDGGADSNTFDLSISVTPVNDPPAITGQVELEVLERSPLTIEVGHVTISDIDSDPGSHTLTVNDGPGYTRAGNTITPDAGVTGELDVSISVSDGELDSDIFPLLVSVLPDDEAPVLTLNGDPYIELIVGDAYIEVGATAIDNLDGDISDRIVVEGSVDTSTAGEYVLTYRVADTAGNPASAERRILVEEPPPPPDTTPPVITLLGDNPQVIITGNAYVELGAMATDNMDGDISAALRIDASDVTTDVAGSYQVHYDVSDAAGNAAQTVVRTVSVEDPAPPPTPPPARASSGGGGGSVSLLSLIVLLLRVLPRFRWRSSGRPASHRPKSKAI